MSENVVVATGRRIRGLVWTVLLGDEDPRLRATWRFLLAAPLILVTEPVSVAVTGALGLSGMLPTGIAQASAFAVLLLGWSRLVDRRPLANYGLSPSPSWALDLLVAVGAILFAHGLWYALGTSLGWTTVEVVASAPDGSLAVVIGATFVAIAVNVWVQDTVFFGVVLRSAAEGFRSRDLTPRHAVLAGWLVGIAFVVVIHGGSLLRPGLFVAGAVFGLLYVHTGELALPIGVHLGVNFSGGWLFAPASVAGDRAIVFGVTETLPVLDLLSGPRIPQMAIAYLLLLGWLAWRRGDVGIEADISAWSGR